MSLTYVIIEPDGQPQDGEFLDHDKAMRWSRYADVGARIFAFDLDAARAGETPLRDVTGQIVKEAYQAGIYDCDDEALSRARDGLPGEFIDFPQTADDVIWNRADAERDRINDERAMGWVR